MNPCLHLPIAFLPFSQHGDLCLSVSGSLGEKYNTEKGQGCVFLEKSWLGKGEVGAEKWEVSKRAHLSSPPGQCRKYSPGERQEG